MPEKNHKKSKNKKTQKLLYFLNSIFKRYPNLLIYGWVTISIDSYTHPHLIFFPLNINSVIYKTHNFHRKIYISSSSQYKSLQPAILTTKNVGGTMK